MTHCTNWKLEHWKQWKLDHELLGAHGNLSTWKPENFGKDLKHVGNLET